MSDDDFSSKSQTSIGFPGLKSSEGPPSVTGGNESPTSSANLEQVDLSEPDSLRHFIPKDAICLVVICEPHNALSLQSVTNCYFLPSVEIDSYQQSFSELIIPVLAEMIPNYDLTDDSVNPQLRVQLVDQYRVQLPKTNHFLQRFIFRTCFYLTSSVLDNDETSCEPTRSPPCICNTSNSEDRIWLSIDELKLRRDNIWGGELIEYFCSSSGDLDSCRLVELDINYPKQSLASLEHLYDGLSNMESTSVFLFNAFVVHCFPSNTMSFTSFCDFCDRLCWMIDIETRRKIFRSFDRHCRGFLDFVDLLQGLILFDSENGYTEISERHGYIFRYYDSNQDNMLEYDEFRQLVLDFYHVNSGALQAILRSINKARPTYLNEMVEGLWTELVKSHEANSMNFEKYHTAFEQINSLIGCRVCWLPTVSCLDKVNQRFNCRTMAESNLQRLVEANVVLSQCEICMTIKYSLSSLSVHLDLAGQVDHLYHYKPYLSSIVFIEEFQEKNIFRLANEFMIRIEKIGFNQSTLRLSADNLSLDFFFSNRDKMLQYMYQIVEFAKRLFENESKILELNSPAFVFGELNGQLQDLFHLRQLTFRTYPTIDSSALLFLGNYISQDSYYNLECLIYLLCLKVLTPDKIFLLRSAHKRSDYLKITSALLDEPLGLEIVKIVASIFESLPVAAVIDHQIFAAHSGIPTSTNSIYMIKSIANWNDSVDSTVDQEYTYHREQNTVSGSQDLYCEPNSTARPSMIAIFEQVVQQLTFNTPSDTEQVGTFTPHQLNTFLVYNNLCTMIRSHPREETENGFHSPFDYSLVTLRSSTLPGDGYPTPTCAFLDHSRFRLILLDAPDANNN